MEATSKENMAKITISEELGVAELKYATVVNVEGGIAAPPIKVAPLASVKIAVSMLKFPGSVMNKVKTLKFLLIVAMMIFGLQIYNLMLYFGLQGVVSNPVGKFCAAAGWLEIGGFLFHVNSVMGRVAQLLVLVCYLLMAIWK